MMGYQCPTCMRYRGDLTCDAFPQGFSFPTIIYEFQVLAKDLVE